MKLFVTGATGFIGSHLVNQAHAAGHEVIGLRRLPTSKPRITLAKQPTWIDSALDEVPESAFSGCDAVVHLAAHTANVPYDTLENCIRWNVLAPLTLFRTAISAGIDRFVVAGSCFEYGRSGERYEFIPPDAPLEPTHSYPASKAAASIAFSQLAIEENLRLSIHRIFQVFGEGEAESRLWPSLKRAAESGNDFPMTSGNQVRDFVSVTEVAKKIVDSVVRDDIAPGEPAIENVGSGNPCRLRDFAEEWWSRFGANGKLQFGALPSRPNEVTRYVPELSQRDLQNSAEP
ncbi:NAD-dependent epimerase/dehydratase family protein [Crateriforma spongiae]|uniref:NAD-dependent epimerase/dehydratase family protein n=1 Tax=Crateriforma spongiae TaxID=2724528 RepID=UPI00144699C9|nr:NAD(P)-dependent oxidoreductase [Crateriforma spongiae]